jgi:hypothetical protein
MTQQQPLQETRAGTSSNIQPFGQQGGGTMQQGQPGMMQQGGGTMQQGQPGTMQQGGGTMQQGGRIGQTLEDAISSEMRITLQDFVEAANACEWCADQCLDEGPQMAECVRLCRDVADLAVQNVQFIARDSIFGPETAEIFATAAEECARECAQHSHEHCQECASVLQRASKSTFQMLDSFGRGQGGSQSQQPQQFQQY